MFVNKGVSSPNKTGFTLIQYSSIRLCCIKTCVMLALPMSKRFLPGGFFMSAIFSAVSSLMIIVFFQFVFSRVLEKTIFKALFTQLACSISCFVAVGLSAAVGQ